MPAHPWRAPQAQESAGGPPPGGPPAAGVLTAPWAARRDRAGALRERYPFAREPLDLYRALLVHQESAWSAARAEAPAAGDLPGYVAERVLPRVVEATAAAGPRALADLAREHYAAVPRPAAEEMIRRWLAGEDQTPAERYLARAAAGPVLEALGERAREACAGARDDRHCPVCGGLPQVSYIAAPVESLASGPRSLVCARCAATWAYPRLTCAACGEQDSSRLAVFAEEGTEEVHLSGGTVRGLRGRAEHQDGRPPRFPHMRVDACTACSKYLLSVDLGRDPRAVPLVDELAAIPLDLYAVESGFTKVVPNLMGA